MTRIALLIVDDNEIDRYVLKRQLKSTGLEVACSEAVNGADALRYFDEHEAKRSTDPDYPPLVIFLDINMPLVNGHEFLRRFAELRTNYSVDASVVMMFTSSDREEDRHQALAYDFVREYLVKGQIDTDQLREKIEKLLVHE